MKSLLLLLAFPLLAAAEPATMVRATELKAQPATDAVTVVTLAENAAVDALERKGGWTRVRAGNEQGWVRMLALRFGGPGAAKSGDSGLSQLFNAARTGSSGTQVTTGARGLDAAQLTNAQPNPREHAKMRGFAAERNAAAGFAAEGGLSAIHLEYPSP